MTKAMKEFVAYVNETIVGGDKQEDNRTQSQKSNASMAQSFPKQSTASVTPRPTDPLKAQIWDSKYGSGWNSDGTAKNSKSSNASTGTTSSSNTSTGTTSDSNVAAPKPTSQQDLAKMGLKIKQGDVQKEGSEISPTLIELAKKIQAGVPGFAYFSGFNDKFHQENAGSSEHTKGLALDFALGTKPNKEEGAKIASILQGMGASYVQDEYNNASAKATGGHFHAAVSAANGAILSGPTSGYKPNLTMHGTEAIVPLNTPAQKEAATGGMDTSLMSAQLDRLDEMVSLMKNQLGVSTKIMQYNS
jgi:hypothetical protein